MRNRSFITVMAAVALASCDEPTLPAGPEQQGTVDVELSVVMPESQSQTAGGNVQTRTAVSPDSHDSNMSSFYMCTIPEVEENIAWYYALGYDLIQVAPSSWSGARATCYYYLRTNNESFYNTLGFFPTKGSVKLYAAYPAVSNLHTYINPDRFDSIPYTLNIPNPNSSTGNTTATDVGNNHDYMYMVDGNSGSPTYMQPIRLDMTGRAPNQTITQTLYFKHVMTCMELRMRATLTGTVIIDSIALDVFDAADQRAKVISKTGIYSIKNGLVVKNTAPGSTTHHYTISFNKTLTAGTTTGYTTFPFIFPQIEHIPGGYIRATIHVRRYFNGSYTTPPSTDEFEGQTNVLIFPFNDILTDLDGLNTGNPATPEGLLPGYRYVYSITMDNFIKYRGYPEVEPWTLATDPNRDDLIKEITI